MDEQGITDQELAIIRTYLEYIRLPLCEAVNMSGERGHLEGWLVRWYRSGALGICHAIAIDTGAPWKDSDLVAITGSTERAMGEAQAIIYIINRASGLLARLERAEAQLADMEQDRAQIADAYRKLWEYHNAPVGKGDPR